MPQIRLGLRKMLFCSQFTPKLPVNMRVPEISQIKSELK